MFREYRESDRELCLAVFDSNVPQYFTDEERDLFDAFLQDLPGPYFVMDGGDGRAAACGGYAIEAEDSRADLCWGMVRGDLHGQQLGRALTELRISEAKDDPRVSSIALNTSQHTKGFYQKMGFEILEIIEDGYAPGLHRVEMRSSWK